MEVMLAEVMALKAYSAERVKGQRDDDGSVVGHGDTSRLDHGDWSVYVPTWYNRPWSEKIVMCLS